MSGYLPHRNTVRCIIPYPYSSTRAAKSLNYQIFGSTTGMLHLNGVIRIFANSKYFRSYLQSKKLFKTTTTFSRVSGVGHGIKFGSIVTIEELCDSKSSRGHRENTPVDERGWWMRELVCL